MDKTKQPELRAAIVAEAQSWIGTRYMDNQQRKCNGRDRGGVDCGRLLIGVYTAVGLISDFNPPHESMQICLHREDETYINYVRQFAREIPEDQARPGDVVLWLVARAYHHGAIIVRWPNKVIHAVNPQGVLYEDPALAPRLTRRDKKFFTMF